MTADQALRQMAERQAALAPPGGFDAWLHILAVPAPAPSPAGLGAGGEGAEREAAETEGAGVGRDSSGQASAGAGDRGGVRVETVSLTAPNDAGQPLRLFFIPPEHAAGLLAERLARLGAECRGPAEGEGYLVQVGVSGMEFRTLGHPPAGFVPRYRLPRRSLPEPVWAADEPVWYPCARLRDEPGRVAEELVARLAARLEGHA